MNEERHYGEFDFQKQGNEQPEASVQVMEPKEKNEKANLRKYTILATGKIGKKERTVNREITVNWVDKNRLQLPNVALIASDKIELHGGGSIEGNVYLPDGTVLITGGSIGGNVYLPNGKILITGGTIEKDVYLPNGEISISGWGSVKGKVIDDETVIDNDNISVGKNINFQQYHSYTDELFENYHKYIPVEGVEEENQDSKVITNKKIGETTGIFNGTILSFKGGDHNAKLTLQEDTHIPVLEMTAFQNLTIDTNGEPRVLVVDRLNIAGHVETNASELTIIVTNSIQIAGSLKTAPERKGKINLVYLGASEFSPNSQYKLEGNLFIEGPAAFKQGSSSQIIGNIIYNGERELEITGGAYTGNPTLILAPKSDIKVNGSGTFEGMVIGKSYEAVGSGKLIYKPVPSETLPGISGGNSSESGGANNLISSGPTLEKSEVSE